MLEAHPEWEVCGEASNGQEAVQKAVELQPDVVIMDISMPGLSGLQATRQIREALPQTEVLILTMHESEKTMRDVLQAGARGYVLKSEAPSDLLASIQALHKHNPCSS